QPTEPCTDRAEVIELVFIHRGDGVRKKHPPNLRYRTRTAVGGGSLEVGLDTPYPARVNLPIITDLAATEHPAVAHRDRARYHAQGQCCTQTRDAGIGPGIGDVVLRRADPSDS